MTVGVPSQTRAAKAGAKGATKVARKRRVRRAARPAAKATWLVGKKVVKRKAKKHARRYGDAVRTAGMTTLIYVPMAAEVLGVAEPAKPRRRAPAFLAGMALGAGLMYPVARRRTRRETP
jgi:hypothetical protein